MSGRAFSRVVGAAIGLVGLAFVVRLVVREQDTLAALLRDGNPLWFLLALGAGLLGMSGIGLTWGVIVRDLDRELPVRQTLRAYFVGQLGKYVPGGIWAVMGRGEWATREGIGRGAAYLSTLLSMITAYLAASAVVLICLVAGARTEGSNALVFGIAALAPLGVAALHPRLFGMALEFAGRLRRRPVQTLTPPRMQDSVRYLVRQIPSWLLIVLATWSVGQGLGADLGVLPLALATCASWVAGFLFLPTPGGIGIREAAFVAVLGGGAAVAVVALAARLVFVLVDGLGAALSSTAVGTMPKEVA